MPIIQPETADSALCMIGPYADLLSRTFDRGGAWDLIEKRYMQIAGWIPLQRGHWGEWSYDPVMEIDRILLNESRNQARVDIRTDDFNVYQLCLAPDSTGRWQAVKLRHVGYWCE